MKLNYLKYKSLLVAQNLSRIESEKVHARTQLSCGNVLRYSVTPGTLEMHFKRASWCRLRSCPTCNWVRAIKRRVKVFGAIEALTADIPTVKFAFLTLTVKNCHQSELRNQVRLMEQGWRRFFTRNGFPALGFLKALEVTRPRDCFYRGQYLGRFGYKVAIQWLDALKQLPDWNPEGWRDFACEECHPHFHVLLALPESYRPGSSDWLDHLDWVTRWKLCMKLSYRPVVDIRSCYSKEGNGLKNAVYEATKYVLKPLDMLDRLAPFIFRQLHGVALTSVGGLFRNYLSDELLQKIDEEMANGEEFQQNGVLLEYQWGGDQYWISRIANEVFSVY